MTSICISIKRRCLALGYDEGDFMAIALQREVCQVDKPMSDRGTCFQRTEHPLQALNFWPSSFVSMDSTFLDFQTGSGRD